MNPWVSKLVDEVIDALQGIVPAAELRFCRAVYRRTLAWKKYSEVIPSYVLLHGSDKCGFLPTFLDKRDLWRGRKAIKRGLVFVTGKGKKTRYMLNVPILLSIYNILSHGSARGADILEGKREARGTMREDFKEEMFVQSVAIGEEDLLEERDVEAARAVLAGKPASKKAFKAIADKTQKAQAAAKKKQAARPPTSEFTVFVTAFRDSVKKHHPGIPFLAQKTGKNRGQVGHLLRYLREAKIDPLVWIDRVAANWLVLSGIVRNQYGQESPLPLNVIDLSVVCVRWAQIADALLSLSTGTSRSLASRFRVVRAEGEKS
jgi:hypothetical protein